MRTTQLPASTRQPRPSHSSRSFQALLGLGLASCLLLVSVGPAQAWWFEAMAQGQLTPSQSQTISGLTVRPLAQPVSGSFVLQPLIVPTIAPTALPTPKPTTKPAQVAAAVATTVPQQILDLVNKERAKSKLVPLQLNAQLTTSAQAFAEVMQRGSFFSHTSPNGDTLKERNEAAGYVRWSWMGENIGYGQNSTAEVMTAWMNSEGHRKNILDPRGRELGVGYAPGSTDYWVQEFGAQF